MLKFKKTGSVFTSAKEPTVPEGLWIKCEGCGELLYKEDVRQNHYVCYKCGKYFRVSTKKRLRMVADKGTYEKWDEGIENKDPLEYPEYQEKTASLKERYRIDGEQAVVCVCDGRFLMGSMGYVVGEKITRAVERATEEYLPVIIFTCSGGARMQEGMVSLMQMAKTSAALKRHSEAGLLYVSVLTDPTTGGVSGGARMQEGIVSLMQMAKVSGAVKRHSDNGGFYLTIITNPTTGGVTASFAMLGDIILAEPGALVGFAGPRVIEQTIRQKLPEGFQRAEFLLEHGLIDNVVEREDLKETLVKLIVMHRRVEPKEYQPGNVFCAPEPRTDREHWSIYRRFSQILQSFTEIATLRTTEPW